jgi:cytochrome c
VQGVEREKRNLPGPGLPSEPVGKGRLRETEQAETSSRRMRQLDGFRGRRGRTERKMKKWIALGLLTMFYAGLFQCVFAGQAEDAKALAEKAVEMFKDNGPAATIAAINDKNGPLRKGDLYVFAGTPDNRLIGHPDHSIRGIPLNNFKDANGVPVFHEFGKIAQHQGSGWVDYLWVKPGESRPSKKRSFIIRIPGENIYMGVGYYLE